MPENTEWRYEILLMRGASAPASKGLRKGGILTTTHLLDRSPIARVHWPAAARVQLAWLAGGILAGFAVPFVFAEMLELPRDIYYGIYIAFVAVFFVLWARTTGQSLAAMVRRRWLLSVGLAVGASTLLAAIVLGKYAT